MQGHWANAAPYYRCRFPRKYALANRSRHPLNVTLRQDALLEPLDAWLAGKFEARHLPTTIDELTAATTPDLERRCHHNICHVMATASMASVQSWFPRPCT